jgi:hypothetical protein
MNRILVAVLLAGLLLAACGSEQEQEAAETEKAESVFATLQGVAVDGDPVTLAGITFTPPGNWIDMGPSGMRKANYAFGPLEGNAEAANVAVFYFGADEGGTVQANIDRWISQIRTPDGGPSQETAVRDQFAVDGMAVSTVEVAGSYDAGMGGPMGGRAEPREGFMLVGAVVQGPQGNVFFKLTGPEESALAMAQGFVAMIKGTTKAPAETS